MRLYYTRSFREDYRRLPQSIKDRLSKQLGFLLENPGHPSLRLRKMVDPREIWEARVTRKYRLTFQIQGDLYLLRRVGPHDVLDNP